MDDSKLGRYIKIGRRVVIPRWALEERLRLDLAEPVGELTHLLAKD